VLPPDFNPQGLQLVYLAKPALVRRPAISETIYDGGLRRATVEQYRAQYDQTVANYRGIVLTAFQQVEDNLSTLRVLSKEIQEQDTAIQSAQRSLNLATDRYRSASTPTSTSLPPRQLSSAISRPPWTCVSSKSWPACS